MKELCRIVLVLTVICLLCAFCLSYVYSVAEQKIIDNTKKAVTDAITNLAPWSQKIEENMTEKGAIYKLFLKNGDLGGYAFLAEGQGYQGKIKILAVIDSELSVLKGIEVIESVETPGLGARINEKSFCSQFNSLDTTKAIQYTKDRPQNNNQIQAITGATISSKAVVNILNKRIKDLRGQL